MKEQITYIHGAVTLTPNSSDYDSRTNHKWNLNPIRHILLLKGLRGLANSALGSTSPDWRTPRLGSLGLEERETAYLSLSPKLDQSGPVDSKAGFVRPRRSQPLGPRASSVMGGTDLEAQTRLVGF
ncbi:hypothetical protein CRG98_038793 [Punica granatum]|uniref:Uncharacterized protein n=1 Tax=Punica granatum TaxID=22663 RepID=A0A2I0I9X7_PUNGR|nr:hypothetical protein CRG98_038793 [Punica granatum]